MKGINIMDNGSCCGCGRWKMGILVILFGLVFLLGAVGVFSADVVAILWPIVIILAGLAKLIGCSCKSCKK